MTDGALAIGSFSEGDRAAVIALWRQCGLTVPHNDPDADITFAAGSATSDVLVGSADGLGVAATVMVGHDGHRGRLYYVAVTPSLRGRGHGRAMVAAGEAWLKAQGVRKAQLMIRETNTGMRAFYAGLGWGEIPRIVMERWL